MYYCALTRRGNGVKGRGELWDEADIESLGLDRYGIELDEVTELKKKQHVFCSYFEEQENEVIYDGILLYAAGQFARPARLPRSRARLAQYAKRMFRK